MSNFILLTIQKMFLQKFFLGLIEIFVVINILTKCEVKSEISALDKCIEEESERLLLKRKELAFNLYISIDVDVDGITKNLAKSICYFVLPSFENTQNEEDAQKIMTDDPDGYENHNMRRTLEKSDNENGINEEEGIKPEEEIPTGISEPEINNSGRITLTVNDISNGELSNPPIEEEKHEKNCDKGSKITKSEIKKILTSFMKKVPLKVLIQQKLKEENSIQQQEQIIPRFMYQQDVRRSG